MTSIFEADFDHSQEMFDLLKQALIDEKSWWILKTQEDHALDLMRRLATLLRAGQANQTTLNMLADFVQGVSIKADKSTNSLKQDVKLTYRIFDHKPNGKPTKELQGALMIGAFFAAKNGGADEEAATRVAYDKYFERESRTYEADHSDKAKRTMNGEELSTAEISMNRVIRPMLLHAGLIGKKPSGRPRKLD